MLELGVLQGGNNEGRVNQCPVTPAPTKSVGKLLAKEMLNANSPKYNNKTEISVIAYRKIPNEK